jgi:hypothetical protein
MARLSPNELAARIEREELRLMLGDRKFRRFLWRLLGKSGMFTGSARSNPAATSRDEGRRDLGNEVLTELRLADPGALILILSEYSDGLPGHSTGEPEASSPGDDDDTEDD